MADAIARGPLSPMPIRVVRDDVPVRYGMPFADVPGTMNDLLGQRLEIRFLDRIECRACGAPTRRSYGGGYCYGCFKTLARCDLCIVSPERCHYAQGTCREPRWAEEFCMSEHVVYLANTGGLKVGITRATNVPGRWLDQGATQARPLLRASSRERSGWAERALAQLVSDRADWRAVVSREPLSMDLEAQARALRERSGPVLESVFSRFPNGLAWIDDATVQEFAYPVTALGPPRRLSLSRDPVVTGTLLGLRGQHLLFDSGAFNVAGHTSYHVQLAYAGPPASEAGDREQLCLF